MKTYAKRFWAIPFAYFTTVFCLHAQTIIDEENFESGNFSSTIWNDGGSDCSLTSSSILSGIYAVNLQDNSNKKSSTYTDNIDLRTYESVTITFDFRTSGFNNGHDFYVEFSNNNGNNWKSTPILHYVAGTDFNNDTTYTGVSASISDGNPYNFTKNSRFRFRADAANNNDELYIDNIIITGQTAGGQINILDNGNDITNSIDFGQSGLGTPISKTYTINNSGTSDLIISSITTSNTTDFAITGTPYSSPVSSGNSTDFTVTFLSNSIGNASSTITVNSNATVEPSYQFTVLASAAQSSSCGTTITSYPYNEDYESGIGLWTQDSGDDFDWTRNANGTLSNQTGPSSANSGSYYMYTEASSNYNNTSNFESPCFDLTSLTNPKFTFSYHMYGSNMGTLNVDISTDNGLSYPTTLWSQTGGVQTSNNDAWNTVDIDLSAYAGQTVKIRFQGTTGSSYRSDMAIDNVSLINNTPSPEINIQGNSIDIVDGDTTPTNTDHTDFGTANLSTPISKTFTIYNTGNADLTISSITTSNTTDFSITGTPYNSPVSSGNNTTFTITFLSVSIGNASTTITVNNNDADESTYQFNIQAEAEQNFFDSDHDGILDNIDIDDDNDGISDSEEELACKVASISSTTNYKFLNETFGTGNRTTINTTYAAETTYCYEDGTSGTNTAECSSLSSNNLNDGEYTVYYKSGDGDGINDTPNGEVASWADTYWYTGEDHTSGDTNGRMAMFNASYDPGTFYTATIIGALPNIPITYSFWVLNLDTTDAPNIGTRLRPNILVEFRDVNNNVLASITTGDIPPSINGDPENSWHQFTADLTFGVSEFYVYFINNEVGGGGNDLAIDDIVISQTLCDTDTDGVANVFDLDSDNDGIPDVIESGLGNYSDGNATLTNSTSWVDANNNGMHDLCESHTSLDSDGDSIPNYLDLDSDNDTLFDVDESGAGNSADPNYQNGDGDITGDGVGDGTDSDMVRETDIDSDGVLEHFTDGILDIYDFFNGSTMSTAYGNSNQGSTGTGWHHYVADTDNDGIPDYIDVSSDGSTFDITGTLYASLDANNDGIIDGSGDAEGDGIIDTFDTDNTRFGSPRDLNQKLNLYFDGRNDYAAESSVINNWNEVSLMSWIKIDPTATGSQIITGQDKFYIQLNSDKSITAYADGHSISYTTALNTNVWTHIAITYSDSEGLFKLYINGTEVANTTVSGALSTDTSSFTIGRNPDTDSQYFKGYIDEVRIFSKALSTNELQKMVYQEIENNGGVIRGSIIPLDITDYDDITETSTPLNWSYLTRYYQLDTYKDDIIDDLSTASIDEGTGAKIYNTKIIDIQNAPLPFITTSSCNGSWSDTNNWEHGDIWDVTNLQSTCAIVQIKGNIQLSTNLNTVGLFIDNGSKLNMLNDSGLFNSWYLKLDGEIDLEGESQLIQSGDSTLDPSSSGTLEKDQQGTADTYTYNYWSSPVGFSNSTTNNNSYKVTDVFTNVNFLTTGYNGSPSPVGISDYWIWKFSNQESDNYSKWQHVRSTNSLLVGEGFTMKGPGTGPISMDQNYILSGKPNNGTIQLNINNGNDYLVGNPYPSAIDAEQFILDNGNTIAGSGSTTGVLYFWEHWGGGSHNLGDYQGGYATYSLSGGVPAATLGTNDPDVGTGGTPTKIPGRYIPVGQGFFVTAENTGTIIFKNSQRVFEVENGSSSLFMKVQNESKNIKGTINISSKISGSDARPKLRIGFNSVNTIHRQLLLTVDENATTGYDWGYDALYHDTQIDDMYWLINDEKYTIQSINNTGLATILPLGIHTKNNGVSSISIDQLEQVPDDLNIYLHDKTSNVYHDLRQSSYNINLPAGEYLNRFEITFSTEQQQTLSTDNIEDKPINVFFSKEKKQITIQNPSSKLIESIEVFNMLGQSLFMFETKTKEHLLTYNANPFETGYYIVKLKTPYGKLSKKILIEK